MEHLGIDKSDNISMTGYSSTAYRDRQVGGSAKYCSVPFFGLHEKTPDFKPQPSSTLRRRVSSVLSRGLHPGSPKRRWPGDSKAVSKDMKIGGI